MKKQKLLYVDDEEVNLYLFDITFRDDYEVISASSARDGMIQLKLHPDINLVITDMRMPGINGLEFVEMADKVYPSKIYFLLTGFQKTAEIEMALNSGKIQEYMTKPFQKEQLSANIDRYISQKRMTG